MAEWHTVQSARSDWADARKLDEETVQLLLELAQDACWFFDHARVADDGTDAVIPETVPPRYRVAQLLLARTTWQMPRVGDDPSQGLDGYAGRVYVFGKDIQKVLVPPVYGEQVG